MMPFGVGYSRPSDHHVDVRPEVLVPAPGDARGLDRTGVGLGGIALLAHISALLLAAHDERSRYDESVIRSPERDNETNRGQRE